MLGFFTYILILSFISPCFCTRLDVGTKNAFINVMQFGARGDGIADDTQAFASAWDSACKAGGMSTLVIPAGRSFRVTKINFSGPCKAKINIQLEGKIVAPSKEAWKLDGAYWISIQYLNGLTIDGNGKGEIDGYGSTWWHCESCERPKVYVLFFHACNDLIVRNLGISNSPQSHVSVNMCNRATFSHISINAPATSPNTDGFDISDSTNILIQDSNIKSGDDCIAVNGGSSFINATRVTCGPGHGISVGSLGRNGQHDMVSDVYILNCTFIGTSNGARIKTFEGGSGYAKRITFDQIILQNVRNPIIIDQNYSGVEDEATNVEVSFVTYRGFRGTSTSDYAINLVCGPSIGSTCKNAHGTARNTIPNVPCLIK
ncbi:probable polygalacturonase At3g15720 [Cicer arietinum]|uniref:Probable polygalacturonase At3g15720 n=1 Tax=Cicer arietinum TaxID=3827 RepID=A0A1S2YUM1_CICAR|nr:probable polygalacturonase At3g15720 [Cicer arietinum]